MQGLATSRCTTMLPLRAPHLPLLLRRPPLAQLALQQRCWRPHHRAPHRIPRSTAGPSGPGDSSAVPPADQPPQKPAENTTGAGADGKSPPPPTAAAAGTPAPAAADTAASPAPSSPSAAGAETSSSSSSAAAAAEEPEWWILRTFEKRRREQEAAAAREEQRKQDKQQQQEEEEEDAKRQQAKQKEKQPPPPPEWRRAALLQCVQLGAGLAALILWPASLTPGGIFVPRVWALYFTYFAFFYFGSVRRVLKHGPLARASDDRQRATPRARAALIAFICCMPIIHWLPLRRYLTKTAAQPIEVALAAGPSLYDVLGIGLIVAAAVLNWRAAAVLGAAYDRVVAPKALVKEWPYSVAQHPIYGSYILLFVGYCFACHSAPLALVAAWACGLYFRSRAALESQVLSEAFGQEYQDYRTSVRKQFIPYVV